MENEMIHTSVSYGLLRHKIYQNGELVFKGTGRAAFRKLAAVLGTERANSIARERQVTQLAARVRELTEESNCFRDNLVAANKDADTRNKENQDLRDRIRGLADQICTLLADKSRLEHEKGILTKRIESASALTDQVYEALYKNTPTEASE